MILTVLIHTIPDSGRDPGPHVLYVPRPHAPLPFLPFFFFLLIHLCFVSCAASLYLSKMSHMYELSALSRELWIISVTLALFRRPNLLISPQVRG